MHAVITSKKDLAGMNIKESLLKNFNFVKEEDINGIEIYTFGKIKLYSIEKDTIFFEECEKLIKAENYIFATRHQSKSGEKTLSVHFPGNFSKAEFGGTDNELCFTSPSILKQAFLNLNKNGKDSGYQITLEATHHGPLIKKPVFFIEIGSKKTEWNDKFAGNIIAKTIIDTLKAIEKSETNKENEFEYAIGFGGSHYCAAFNKIELESNIALGHICPKYQIDSLDVEMVKKMLCSAEKIDYALLDWKGMDANAREKVTKLLDFLKIKWKKTKEI